jgi:hypothetical protein
MYVSYELKEGGHHCARRYDHSACGEAITECFEDTDGRFWVGNDEYANQVGFCPFCGAKAPTPPQYQHVGAPRYLAPEHEPLPVLSDPPLPTKITSVEALKPIWRPGKTV